MKNMVVELGVYFHGSWEAQSVCLQVGIPPSVKPRLAATAVSSKMSLPTSRVPSNAPQPKDAKRLRTGRRLLLASYTARGMRRWSKINPQNLSFLPAMMIAC